MLLVISAVNIGLALVVLIRKPHDRGHRAFAGAVSLIVLWLVAAYLSDQRALASSALYFNRLTLALAALMSATIFHFIGVFPRPYARFVQTRRVLTGVGVVLAILTVLSPLIVSSVEFQSNSTGIVAGPLFPLLVMWLCIGLAVMAALVAAKMRHVTGRERAQLKYVLLGYVLFSAVSLIQGLLIPLFTGTYATASLNTFATLILVGTSAYAMIAHRFMDIRFVVLRAAGYLVLLTLTTAVVIGASSFLQSQLLTVLGISPQTLLLVGPLLTLLLFYPLKRAAERITDRIFYHTAYDPDALLNELGTAIVSRLSQPELASLLAKRLATGMRLSFAAAVFWRDGALEFATSSDEFSEADARRLAALCPQGLLVTDELDPGTDEAMLLEVAGVRVLMPFGPQPHWIGAVFLGAKQSGSVFTSADMSFLETIARETAVAARNAQLFHERNRRVAELTAINRLAASIEPTGDTQPMLEQALQLIVSAAHADSGSIMLMNRERDALSIAASTGLRSEVPAGLTVEAGSSISSWVAEHQEPLLLVDDTDPRFVRELTRQEVGSSICVPIVFGDQVAGILSVNRSKSRADLFSSGDLRFVIAFAQQLAIALENNRLYDDLQRTFLGTISALAAAVDAKDPYTYGHASWVTRYAVATANSLHLAEPEVQTIRIASVLHDIGKIGINGTILRKPDSLTAEELEEIRRHPAIGADILSQLEFLSEAVPLVLFHHEHYSGGGYPSGISGSAIPLGARIIAVADAYDAMTSDRPYRTALTGEQARQELRMHSGTQFDPAVVQAFLTVLELGEEALRRSDNAIAPPRLLPADSSFAEMTRAGA
jgi:HD-GYP domain-containing protein (c-di-GMP phosphodiesterase class II)